MMIRLASPAVVAEACSSVGMSMTAPALMRLMLSPMKAFGLERNMATSIWSSDTLAGLMLAAIFPAVSPRVTTTVRVPFPGFSSA